jgi:hypothetical protein
MRPRTPAPEQLTAQDLTLLLRGPWAIGCDLSAPVVRHDRLRALFQAHEPTVRAEAARQGIHEIWFDTRDEFVRIIRGEE